MTENEAKVKTVGNMLLCNNTARAMVSNIAPFNTGAEEYNTIIDPSAIIDTLSIYVDFLCGKKIGLGFQCNQHKFHQESLNTEHDRQVLCSCSTPPEEGAIALIFNAFSALALNHARDADVALYSVSVIFCQFKPHFGPFPSFEIV